MKMSTTVLVLITLFTLAPCAVAAENEKTLVALLEAPAFCPTSSPEAPVLLFSSAVDLCPTLPCNQECPNEFCQGTCEYLCGGVGMGRCNQNCFCECW